MHIRRRLAATAAARLRANAAVALLGPRQVGKTTLARELADGWPAGASYLDLERPADRARPTDAAAYLRAQDGRLVVLDKVHRMPELFEILRGVIDDNRRAGHDRGQFLLLGSASLDLVRGLGVSSPTVTRYLNLLCDLGLVRLLTPWHANTGKRLTKAAKVMVRDSGLLHSLLGLADLDAVLGHPAAGPSYESFAIENLIGAAGTSYQAHHYRTARGDEVDLVLVRGGVPEIAVEIKRSTAPSLSPGTTRAIADLGVNVAYLVHPDVADSDYPLGAATAIGLGLGELTRRLRAGRR